jgi:DNA-binding transcriptional MerR regulator/methylmalonyl-CoA mutase cobalamin-binding subunit
MPGSLNPKDLYKIKTIASMTGFNPTLLRAWERRYELLVPTRTATGHRLYTTDDLRVLRRVRVLLDQGRSIGEIVAQGRQRLLSPGHPGAAPTPPLPAPDPSASYPELQRLCQGVLQAALELDDGTVNRLLDQAFALVSPIQVLENLIIPAAHQMGQLWASQVASVAAEHLLTSCLQRRLHRLIDSDGARSGHVRALCCGFPDEFHELGSLVLTYYLQIQGVHVIYLGAALPLDDLARAIQIRQPNWVLLSVTRVSLLEVHKPALIQLIQSVPGKIRWAVGGGAVRPGEHGDLKALGVTLWSPEISLLQLTETLNLPVD